MPLANPIKWAPIAPRNQSLPFKANTGSGAIDVVGSSNVLAAYSVARALSSKYKKQQGPAMDVRRSSDNTQMTINYLASGNLDTATLLAFCGSGSGYVVRLYDQSGNGWHMMQATAASQPVIVNAGVLEVQKGLPSISIGGSSNLLLSSLLTGSSFPLPFTLNAIVNDAGGSYYGGAFGVTNSANYGSFLRNQLGYQNYYNNTQYGSSAGSEPGNILYRQTTIYASSGFTNIIQGTVSNFAASLSGTTSSVCTLSINASGNIRTGNSFNGFFSEGFALNEGSLAKAQALEANQVKYYGVT